MLFRFDDFATQSSSSRSTILHSSSSAFYMNNKKKNQVVERNVRRKLNRLKSSRKNLTKQQIMKTKVSTISPWMRTAINIIGTGLVVYGYVSNHSIAAYIFGGILLLIGIFGKKETIETTVDQFCTHGIDAVINGMIDGI